MSVGRKSAEVLGGLRFLPESGLTAALVESALRRGVDHFLQHAHTMVVVIDDQGRLAALNAAFDRLRQSFPAARGISDFVITSHRERLAAAISSAHRAGAPVREQVDFGVPDRAVRCDCSVVPASHGATLIFAEPVQGDSDLMAVNAQLEDELGATRAALERKTSELQAVLSQAEELAHTDSLTLLPNRRSILADLQRQVTYAERYDTPLAVSMLDLDGFKAINDQFGHSVGDKVLVTVARGLRDRIRKPDQIGRYGGDEFLVILPNATGAAASEQASRLCQYVRTTPLSLVDGPTTRLTLSVGITHLHPGIDAWRALLERADRALYEAKRQGGDRWLILES